MRKQISDPTAKAACEPTEAEALRARADQQDDEDMTRLIEQTQEAFDAQN
jgi:hypothetical protein